MAGNSGTDWGAAFGGGGGSSGSGGSSGGSSGGTDWGGAFGGFAPRKASSGGGGGGFGFHSIVDALGKAGSTVADIGVGIGGTALDIGKAAYVLPDEMMSGKNEQQRMEDYNNRIPFLAALGWGGKKGGSGLTQTIGEAGGKSLLGPVQGSKVVPIGKAYGDNPVMAALNDIANVTMIAAPAAGATGALADATDSAALAKTSGALNAVAEAPGLPLRAGKSALISAAERAIESGAENPGVFARLGVKLTPEYKGLIGAVLEGKAQEKAAQSIIAGAPDTAGAVEALRGKGFNPAADAIDAASHTAPLPEEMAPRASAPAAPLTTPPPEMVTGKELTTALHKAGYHSEANGLATAVRTAAELPRDQVTSMLARQGLNGAADILKAPVPAATTGTDLIAGLEGMTRAKTGAPTPFSDQPVALSADEMGREATKAIRSQTGSTLGSLPGVVKESGKGIVPFDAVTKGTIKAEGGLPAPLAKALSPRFIKPSDVTSSAALGMLDPANHIYTQARLNLSPATLMGRLGGHTTLAGLGAPHPLDALRSAVREFAGRTRGADAEELAAASPRLSKAAALPANKAQMAEDLTGRGGRFARATSKIDTIANKSPIMRWASGMDDALRKGVYLSERHAGVGAEEALTTVNRVLGEFDALSPAEQAIARRAAPFYNWHKQLLMIVSHLAEDNPAKATMLARLGAAGTQATEQTGTPGELKFGSHAISPGFLVPFGEAGTTFKGLGAASLGPVPKAVIGAGTNWNPNSGKPFTGPNSNKGQDYRYEGALQNLRKAFPQVNIADAITGRDQYVRYSDGSRVLKNKQPIPTNSDWVDTLASFAGLRSENTKAAQSRTAAINAKASGTSKKSSGGGTDWGSAFGR